MKVMAQKILLLSALSLLTPMTISAAEKAEKGRSFGIGLNVDSTPHIYNDNKDDYRGQIFFQYRGEKFNLDNESASYRFFKRDNLQLEAIAKSQVRGHGFSSETKIAGLAEREGSIDLGLRAAYETPVGLVSIDATKDVTGNHKGAEADFRIGPGFYSERAGEARNIEVRLIVGVKWQSADTVDYYYGVKNSEATATRAAYKGKSATTPYVGVAGQGNITKNLTFNTSAIYMKAPDEITDSPIVDKDHDIQINAGLTYWLR